jgi:uncharacterized repeat protein (TIGR03833 family)
LDGKKRETIRIGSRVRITKKSDQKMGKLSEGIVKAILTRSESHPHGIKVILENGIIGRVKEVVTIPSTNGSQTNK